MKKAKQWLKTKYNKTKYRLSYDREYEVAIFLWCIVAMIICIIAAMMCN